MARSPYVGVPPAAVTSPGSSARAVELDERDADALAQRLEVRGLEGLHDERRVALVEAVAAQRLHERLLEREAVERK